MIRTNNLSLVSLQLKNVYDLKDWKGYEDPLFKDYNFPRLDDYEIKEWFDTRVSQSSTKNFAVLDDKNKTIGLINIKNIRKILKIANLGVVFDSQYIGRGYGTKALKAIINYYFNEMGMRTLYLDVAKHNKRAIRCYEKCGFRVVNTYTIKDKNLRPEDVDLKEDNLQEEFIIRDKDVYILCHKMKLSKNKYIKSTEQ